MFLLLNTAPGPQNQKRDRRQTTDRKVTVVNKATEWNKTYSCCDTPFGVHGGFRLCLCLRCNSVAFALTLACWHGTIYTGSNNRSHNVAFTLTLACWHGTICNSCNNRTYNDDLGMLRHRGIAETRNLLQESRGTRSKRSFHGGLRQNGTSAVNIVTRASSAISRCQAFCVIGWSYGFETAVGVVGRNRATSAMRKPFWKSTRLRR